MRRSGGCTGCGSPRVTHGDSAGVLCTWAVTLPRGEPRSSAPRAGGVHQPAVRGQHSAAGSLLGCREQHLWQGQELCPELDALAEMMTRQLFILKPSDFNEPGSKRAHSHSLWPTQPPAGQGRSLLRSLGAPSASLQCSLPGRGPAEKQRRGHVGPERVQERPRLSLLPWSQGTCLSWFSTPGSAGLGDPKS